MKSLVLPLDITYYQSPVSFSPEMPLFASLISKWENLETLTLGCGFGMVKMLSEIGLHCKNFVRLEVEREPTIGKDRAWAIATLLPNLQYSVLKKASIGRESLVIISRGCKKLAHLDVSNCIGFKVDEEILKLASRLARFEYKGSRVITVGDYYNDDYDYFLNALSDDDY